MTAVVGGGKSGDGAGAGGVHKNANAPADAEALDKNEVCRAHCPSLAGVA